MLAQAAEGGFSHLRDARLFRARRAGKHHVHLEQHRLLTHTVLDSAENRAQHHLRDLVVPCDWMRPVHQYLRFNDRHEPRFLAERGETRQGVRVCLRACVCRNTPSAMPITARHFVKRAPEL